MMPSATANKAVYRKFTVATDLCMDGQPDGQPGIQLHPADIMKTHPALFCYFRPGEMLLRPPPPPPAGAPAAATLPRPAHSHSAVLQGAKKGSISELLRQQMRGSTSVALKSDSQLAASSSSSPLRTRTAGPP